MANPYDPSTGVGPYDPYGPDIQDPNYPSPIGVGGATPPAPTGGGALTVSYTHLTLPTNREV